MPDVLFVCCEIGGEPDLEVRVEGGRITEVGRSIRRDSADDVVDAQGAAVIPGLHDHHVHLRAMAAAVASVAVGPPIDARQFADRLRAAPGPWVRAIGYHESVAGPLDRHTLDRLVPDRAVRVQHRSGALWVLNTRALELTAGLDRFPDGRLFRADEWLAGVAPRPTLDFGSVGLRAAAQGVVGFTDASPKPGPVTDLDAVPQRVHVMGPVGLEVEGSPHRSRGPVKVLLDDVDLPGLAELASTISDAHREGRPAAVHCVTQAQLVLTVAAYQDAGTIHGDRVEHGSLIPPELVSEVAALGLVVVTQPNFVVERGDQYAVEVDQGDLASLYRVRSLLDAGVLVAAGTDAPYGNADPWLAIRAAVERTLGAGERVDATTALGLFLGFADAPARPRTVAAGAAADLCLLKAPLAAVLRDPTSDAVAMTVIGGDVAFDGR
jgi:predicted amidohydrolase YtcJ